MNKFSELHRRSGLLISLFLILLTLGAFWPLANHDFIVLDDPLYVSENPHIQQGLTWKGLQWAFSTELISDSPNADYWLPVTFLSHMVTIELFGMDPMGHHLVNLGLHTLNTLLLFWLLRRMTKATWPSAFVAALFAVHPLNVESIAWVTARKDVLSTFFGMLTLGAYVAYTERLKPSLYLLMTLFFALGLMAKPMLLTLPFILLLLDYWPLGRIPLEGLRGWSGLKLVWKRIWEKISLFGLAVLFIVITLMAAQRGGGLSEMESISLGLRLANALFSYVSYIGKAIWPRGLVVFYPHPGDSLQTWQVGGAGIFLAFVTVMVIWAVKRRPYLAVGWLWYLGSLVPVIGIVQVGTQGMADRFMYIPLIGLFIILAWGASEVTDGWRYRRVILGTSAGALLSVLLVWTGIQVSHWRNSFTLFEYTLEVIPNNYLAHYSLGVALTDQEKFDEGVARFSQALALRPDSTTTRISLGVALFKQERLNEAFSYFSEALAISPDNTMAHNGLGVVLIKQGKLEQALSHFLQTLAIMPDNEKAHHNLGVILLEQGKTEEAVSHLREALVTNPYSVRTHHTLGTALEKKGKVVEAISQYTQAVTINPQEEWAHYSLGLALAKLGRLNEALPHFSQAIRINPDHVAAHYDLGLALAKLGRLNQAIPLFFQALVINPRYAEAHNSLGFVLTKLGRVEEAFPHFMKALANEPNNENAHYNMGSMLEKQGRLEEATVHYSEAVRIRPDNTFLRYKLGAIYKKLGRPNEAIRELEASLQINPQFSEARNLLEALSQGEGK